MARPRKMISLEEQIKKQEETVLKVKEKYDSEMMKLKDLYAKRNEEKKKENAVVHIFETDSLESIEYKEASGEEMSFVKEDDTWEYASDTTIALTESSM